MHCSICLYFFSLRAITLIMVVAVDGGIGVSIGGSLSYAFFSLSQNLHGMHNRVQKIGFNLTRLYLSFAHGLYSVEQMVFCMCHDNDNNKNEDTHR